MDIYNNLHFELKKRVNEYYNPIKNVLDDIITEFLNKETEKFNKLSCKVRIFELNKLEEKIYEIIYNNLYDIVDRYTLYIFDYRKNKNINEVEFQYIVNEIQTEYLIKKNYKVLINQEVYNLIKFDDYIKDLIKMLYRLECFKFNKYDVMNCRNGDKYIIYYTIIDYICKSIYIGNIKNKSKNKYYGKYVVLLPRYETSLIKLLF